MLVRFARWLGFSHLLYPIDGAHAHRAVQTRQGNKADSSVGTFVHTIHQPRVAPSTRAPWPPRYERFPPPRCLIWSAWFARSYRWQGKPLFSRPHHLDSSAWHCPTPQRRAQWPFLSFLQMSAPVRSMCDVAQRSFSGAAWQRNFPCQHGTFVGTVGVGVGPLRRRYRIPTPPVLMHKSTTIPGHGVCRQGRLVVSSCPLACGLARQCAAANKPSHWHSLDNAHPGSIPIQRYRY